MPLSSTFPASELRYILENSGALMLLSSAKFQSKAEEVMKGLTNKPPIPSTIPKRAGGTSSSENIELESIQDVAAGIMLYTSGTTNRPVCNPESSPAPSTLLMYFLERGFPSRTGSHCTGAIAHQGMELQL